MQRKQNVKNTNIDIKLVMLTVAVILLEIIELAKINGTYEDGAIAENSIGLVLSVFVFFRYKIADFIKIRYFVYALLGGAGVAFIYVTFSDKATFASSFFVAELVVYVWGFAYIKFVGDLLIAMKNKSVNRPSKFFVMGILFFLLSALSVNVSVWPLEFLMVFVVYFWAPLKEKEKETIFSAIVYGVYIGFFIIQGLALLYRPYWMVRYGGFYSVRNGNVGAFFFVFSYTMGLVLWHIIRKKNSKRMVELLVLLSLGGMCSLVWYTGSRAALIMVALVSIVFLTLEEWVYYNKKIKGLVSKASILIVSFLFMLVPTYLAIRYVPQLRHHPVFFHDEYNMEGVITSENINENDLYISFDRAIKVLVRRLDYNNIKSSLSSIIDPKTAIVEDETGVEENERTIENTDTADTLLDEAYEQAYYKDINTSIFDVILGIRKYLYLYYFEHLNFIGHEHSEEVHQITPGFLAGHPHNSYLYVGYSFGIIPGIMFLMWSIVVPIYFLKKIVAERLEWYYSAGVLINILFLIHGMFETASYPGRSIFTIMFLTTILFRIVQQDSSEVITENNTL